MHWRDRRFWYAIVIPLARTCDLPRALSPGPFLVSATPLGTLIKAANAHVPQVLCRVIPFLPFLWCPTWEDGWARRIFKR